jgi:hypothetical protein
MFIVSAQPAVSPKPSESTLYDPPFGQDLEAFLLGISSDDIEGDDVQLLFEPFDQFAGIDPIGTDSLDGPVLVSESTEDVPGTIPVLNTREMNDCNQDQPQGIHHDMVFPAIDLLARIISLLWQTGGGPSPSATVLYGP